MRSAPGARDTALRSRSCSMTCTSWPRRIGPRTSSSSCSTVLVESGRQMIFTSAVPPAELAGVEARLRTRLEGGLVVDLPAPDREIRSTSSRGCSRRSCGSLDPELAAYLASRPAESVRAVHGAAAAGARTRPRRTGHGHRRARARGARGARRARAPRRSRAPNRSSGIVAPTAGGARSREKTVWEWPEIGDRLLEEWR